MQEVSQSGEPLSQLRPLDPLAELMILDTRKRYPMGFFIECCCDGQLDRERLQRALDAVALRHPNIRSCMRWKAGRPFWKTTQLGPQLLWDPIHSGANPWQAFDLAAESGLRLIVFPEQSSSTSSWKLVLFGHHSVCDGLAACELFGEIWTHYADNPLPSIDDSLPSSATEIKKEPLKGDSEKPVAQRQSAVLAEALRFINFFPTPLKRFRSTTQAVTESKKNTENTVSTVGLLQETPYRLHAFTIDEMNSLRALANARSVTLNALILAASFRVFAAWNHEASGSQRGIRVTMPVSMRENGIRRPAENRIGYAFLDRKFTDCQDREGLIQTLAEASAWIKESGAAGMFITAIDMLRKIPGLLWLILRLPICFSTAVVSNLGDAARAMQVQLPTSARGQIAGDVVITRVVGVPPVRPGTTASLGIARYGDQLWLSCLADEQAMGRDAADRILAAVHTECLKN